MNTLEKAKLTASIHQSDTETFKIRNINLQFWRKTRRKRQGNYKNRKYPRLSFAQYRETGLSRNTKFETNVSNIKCYWMLQNARVTAFTVSELLREKQQGGGLTSTIRVKDVNYFHKKVNLRCLAGSKMCLWRLIHYSSQNSNKNK